MTLFLPNLIILVAMAFNFYFDKKKLSLFTQASFDNTRIWTKPTTKMGHLSLQYSKKDYCIALKFNPTSTITKQQARQLCTSYIILNKEGNISM